MQNLSQFIHTSSIIQSRCLRRTQDKVLDMENSSPSPELIGCAHILQKELPSTVIVISLNIGQITLNLYQAMIRIYGYDPRQHLQ